MSNRKGPFEPQGLTIGYKELGTVGIDEFIDALVADMKALRDIYNIRFVTGSRLRIQATNEYGEPVRVQRPGGGSVRYLDTHHYRPACLDYER